jgi:arylsulfatase
MNFRILLSVFVVSLGSALGSLAATAQDATNSQQEVTKLDRTVLPPPAPDFKGKIAQSYQDSTPDWVPALPLTAPAGAPNVLVIVLDDVGFGHLGCYGGPIQTPNLDKLAAAGLRYNNFHTTALCSPSRGALLTGRNHHAIGLAAITEAATGFPGNYGNIPRSAATIAETLKQNGYSTMALGKWHLAPYTAYTAAGPFDRWPLGMGFERFYGFLGGETDQWAPLLIQDNHFIDTPAKPGYHLTEDLVDRAIASIRDQQQANTGRPFFSYLALGANHAPLHAPKEFIEKYKGRFDQGWDQVREETFDRQKKLGIVPQNAQLTPRDPMIKAWADLSDTEKKVYCRLQEAYAGMLDHADHHLGRLFASLDELGVRDNTIIILVSDNGASQEGLQHGATNTDRYRNFNPETVEEMAKLLDKIGGPETDSLYPMGWSLAGNTPFKKWKQDTHLGGNTDPFIVSWPAKIKDVGAIRNQYHHLVDIVPTLLEASGLPAPTSVNGVQQQPLSGVSMAYSFTNGTAKTTKKVQYYEMLGSQAIWADGWTAVAWHKKDTSWDDDKWELYHTDIDFAQNDDLAAQNPEKLKELIAIWEEEAKKNNVLPLDDRRYERTADPGRPVAALRKDEYFFYPGTSILHPLAAPQLLGKEHVITAHVEIPPGGAEGVLACAGGEFGGWTLFIKDGKFHYVHNYLKLKHDHLVSADPISAGKHTLGIHFVPKQQHLKPDYTVGDVTLLVDDKKTGELKGIKVAFQYSAMTGYGLLIGRNIGTSVSHEYETPFAFTGKIQKVKVELK